MPYRMFRLGGLCAGRASPERSAMHSHDGNCTSAGQGPIGSPPKIAWPHRDRQAVGRTISSIVTTRAFVDGLADEEAGQGGVAGLGQGQGGRRRSPRTDGVEEGVEGEPGVGLVARVERPARACRSRNVTAPEPRSSPPASPMTRG